MLSSREKQTFSPHWHIQPGPSQPTNTAEQDFPIFSLSSSCCSALHCRRVRWKIWRRLGFARDFLCQHFLALSSFARFSFAIHILFFFLQQPVTQKLSLKNFFPFSSFVAAFSVVFADFMEWFFGDEFLFLLFTHIFSLFAQPHPILFPSLIYGVADCIQVSDNIECAHSQPAFSHNYDGKRLTRKSVENSSLSSRLLCSWCWWRKAEKEKSWAAASSCLTPESRSLSLIPSPPHPLCVLYIFDPYFFSHSVLHALVPCRVLCCNKEKTGDVRERRERESSTRHRTRSIGSSRSKRVKRTRISEQHRKKSWGWLRLSTPKPNIKFQYFFFIILHWDYQLRQN